MKKSFYLMLLCIVSMFSSCSQTEELSGSDNQKSVQFSVSVDGSMNSRAAVSDITRYIMEVYESDTPSSTAVQHIEQSTGSFDIILKDGVTYSFLFWADYGTPNANTGEYDATDLKAAKIIGQPTKTAWAGSVSFTKGKESSDAYNVTLTHAVAEVNFIQSEDFTKDNNTLAVTFPATYSLNVADGSVTEIKNESASVPAIYTFSTTTKAQTNQIIGTGYIIAKGVSATDDSKTILELTATLNTNETEHTVSNVPFARNYKTNIKGAYSNLYSCNATISCDDTWGEDNDKNLVEGPKNFKSVYTMSDYYQWDAWSHYESGKNASDNNNWKSGNEQYHYGDVEASQSCKDCPAYNEIKVYLGNNPYWDNGAEGIGQQTYVIDGKEYHTGLWVKKYDKCDKNKTSIKTLSNQYEEGKPYDSGAINGVRTDDDYFFLPSVGYIISPSMWTFFSGSTGYYWSSERKVSGINANFLVFNNKSAMLDVNKRSYGCLPMVLE